MPPKCIPAEIFTTKINPEMHPTDHMTMVASLPCGYYKTHCHDVTGIMCFWAKQ